MSTKLTVTVDVKLPALPNFLMFENQFAHEDNAIDIADVTDESLAEIRAKWTEALIAHAQARRTKQVKP